MQGAERAQEHVFHAGVAADDVERVPALRHGALPQHFAGGDDARAQPFHMTAGMTQQQNFAVHAGIKHLAELMLGTATQQIAEVLSHVDGLDLQPVGALPVAHGGGVPEEGRIKMQAAHAQPLFLQQLCGQYAVQPAGKEHDGVGFRAGGGLLVLFHSPHFYEKAGRLARCTFFDMDSC